MISLVLLPGMDGTGCLFAPLVQALPDWLKPVVVDYPADRPLDYKGHLQIVNWSIPEDDQCVLLGESFSGPLALMAAAGKRRNVRGVILCASFISSPMPPLLSHVPFLVTPRTVNLIPWSIRRRLLLGGSGSEASRELLDSIHGTVSPAVMAARARSILGLDCSEALRACPVPILYLAASDDAIVARRSLERIRQVRPDVSSATLAGPHLILQEAPAAAARIIERFVSACIAGACATSPAVSSPAPRVNG